MNRWSSFLLTIAFCLIVAGFFTQIALSYAKPNVIGVDHKDIPKPSATPIPSLTPTPTPPPPTSLPTPIATPTPIQQRTAVTNGFVRMRESKSTSSTIVTELQAGSTVILGNDETSLWQQATYGQFSGYIWKTYLSY